MDIGIRHGKECVVGISGHVGDVFAGHDIGVHIDRIHGIRHQNGIVRIKHFRDIAGVALGAVGDKDLGRIHIHTVALVVGTDGIAQKRITLLRAIAHKGFGAAHGIHAFMERGDHVGSQRSRNIADAQADDLLFRMRCRIFIDTAGDFRKQVAVFDIQIIFV